MRQSVPVGRRGVNNVPERPTSPPGTWEGRPAGLRRAAFLPVDLHGRALAEERVVPGGREVGGAPGLRRFHRAAMYRAAMYGTGKREGAPGRHLEF